MFILRQGVLVAAVWAALLAAPMAQASDKDHERARQAVQAGQVMPLPAVLDKLAASHPGQVLAVEQMLFNRPMMEVAQYATPLPGLWLAGAGSHPGGGINGAAGWNAAGAILEAKA